MKPFLKYPWPPILQHIAQVEWCVLYCFIILSLTRCIFPAGGSNLPKIIPQFSASSSSSSPSQASCIMSYIMSQIMAYIIYHHTSEYIYNHKSAQINIVQHHHHHHHHYHYHHHNHHGQSWVNCNVLLAWNNPEIRFSLREAVAPILTSLQWRPYNSPR